MAVQSIPACFENSTKKKNASGNRVCFQDILTPKEFRNLLKIVFRAHEITIAFIYKFHSLEKECVSILGAVLQLLAE